MPFIQKLPQWIANQIAAGEVIERPASVLKEILENAIDANAREIQIRLQEGGRKLICVTDNGTGIQQADLELVFEQHATSKIRTVEDLIGIQTLGFRGEALSSIASVSKVRLLSKVQSASMGFEMSKAGESVQKPKPVACTNGTSIEMRDLFFNTPARRKFLKMPKTEYLKSLLVFKQIALSHFEIGFTFMHNEKIIYQLPACFEKSHKQRRIAKLISPVFLKNAIELVYEKNNLSLEAWLEDPQLARAVASDQYLFLNNRPIKDKVIQHAIKESFMAQAPIGHFPRFILFLNLDPKRVDVNVHPCKQEVRFEQPRIIHDFIVSALSSLPTFKNKPNRGLSEKISPTEFEKPPLRIQKSEFYCLFNRFIFIGYWDSFYFIDYVMVKKYLAESYLEKVSGKNPLKSKPIDFPLVVKSVENLDALSNSVSEKLLKQFGMTFQRLDSDKVRVTTLPDKFNLVDISGLVKQIFKTKIEAAGIQKLLLDHLEKAPEITESCAVSCLEEIHALEESWLKKIRRVYNKIDEKRLEQFLEKR